MNAQKSTGTMPARERAVAEAVRAACADAAQAAYRDAAMRGLCSEGAMAVAAGAIEALDLAPVIEQAVAEAPAPVDPSKRRRP